MNFKHINGKVAIQLIVVHGDLAEFRTSQCTYHQKKSFHPWQKLSQTEVNKLNID